MEIDRWIDVVSERMGIREFSITDYTKQSTVFLIVNYDTKYEHIDVDMDMYRHRQMLISPSSCEICLATHIHM